MRRIKISGLLLPLFLIGWAPVVIAQSYARGLVFNDAAYSEMPKKAQLTRALDTVPARASIKEFSPTPKSQGQYGTCTAWACAYCARTMVDAIRNNWTNKDSITLRAYSPAFLFRMSSADNSCENGVTLDAALQSLKNKGGILFNDMPMLCTPAINTDQVSKATGGRLRDFVRLFDLTSADKFKIQAVRKSIAEKKPVVIAMLCPPSFDHAYHSWQPAEQPSPAYGGHAMCVVSYDDTLYNGAFEVQNSWGENWGYEGYTWIRYNDFSRFVKYGFELVDLPDPKPQIPDLSGSLRLLLSTGGEMQVSLNTAKTDLSQASSTISPQPLMVYRTAHAYGSGTHFRIYLSNNQPAYVYAIASDLSNQSNKLFPYEDGISAALTYKKNDVAIPDEFHYIELDPNPGEDFLCVLYSRAELNINDVVAKINAGGGSFNQRVYQVLGNRLVNANDIKFDAQKIAFQGISNGKDVVALMVELAHK